MADAAVEKGPGMISKTISGAKSGAKYVGGKIMGAAKSPIAKKAAIVGGIAAAAGVPAYLIGKRAGRKKAERIAAGE